MKTKNKWNLPEWLTAGLAFVYYWIMALYKLTEAPIWQDEAMEYYCSLPVKGAIRGVTEYASMYERMAYIQQQPPLYNWLMCVWLQVYDSEWWYRFSSVVFGFVAAVGLYMVIRKISNAILAAFSVVIYSSIYILMYYIKEASEYSLLVMLLFWGIYLYLLMLDKITRKRILLFSIFCVLAVYTHYGAVFVIIPMAVSILIILLRRKEWRLFWISMLAYAVAGIGAGGALVWFFMIPQSTNQVSTLFSKKEIIIERGSLFGDFLNSIMCVFRWCAIDIDRDWEKLGVLICIAIVILVMIACYVLVRTNNRYYRPLFYINAVIYLLYYGVTKLNIYAYGWYGNRYNMFLFPMWLVLTIFSIYEFVQILYTSSYTVVKKLAVFVKFGIVIISVLYCCYGDYRIHNHWGKMDLRTVVATWYDRKGYEIPTLLDYHQRYGFVYYFTHNENYKEEQWNLVSANQEVETYATNDTEVWINYLNNLYSNDMPKEMYLVTGQWNSLVDAVVEMGYSVEPIVDINAKLYYLQKTE